MSMPSRDNLILCLVFLEFILFEETNQKIFMVKELFAVILLFICKSLFVCTLTILLFI